MLLRINQFSVETDFALPCDEVAAHHAHHTDGELLRVRRAAKPLEMLPPASTPLPAGSVRFHRVAGGVLLGIEERITMLVDNGGHSVEVQTRDEHLPEAALYVLGSAMALCTALRGDVPLHASSVQLDGQRIAFLAPCGTGKSTTMWAFLEAGALFANDDLIPVRLSDGGAQATSAVSLYPKVGADLMARQPRDWTLCREILPGRGKFWFPLSPQRRAPESGPLTALFTLQPFEPLRDELTVHIERQSGIRAIPHLVGNSMTGTILPSILGTQRLMANFARLAAAVPVYTVRYPKCYAALPEVVCAVRQVLAGAAQNTLTP